jgi:hypothetical protein
MFNRIIDKLKNHPLGFQLALFTISTATFILPFIPRNISWLKYISVIVRYNNLRFLPVLSIVLFLTLTVKNVRRSTLLTALTVFPICALALVGLWASMYSEGNVIAGMLPRIDAFSFYTSSMTLIEKGYLTGYTQRRPLFGGFFAVLIWLFNRNFEFVMIFLAFLCAIALFLALIEVRRFLNPIAAVIFFIPQFMFYRMYIGNVMSETLGFFLGMASFLMFLRALNSHNEAPNKSLVLFALATFLFTLSQLARPGALLTIPFVIIFAGWLFKNDKLSSNAIAIVLISIALAFLLNRFLFVQISQGDSGQLGNAGFGLYGVVAGGKSWAGLQNDHPEIAFLPDNIREKLIMEIILSEFLDHPENFLKGMQVQFYFIFSLFPLYDYNIYSYMLSSDTLADTILIGVYYLLSILGLTNLFFHRKNPFCIFITVLIIGFFISLPVSPAYQSQFMRYYPATIPLLGILPAIGMEWASSKFFRKAEINKPIMSEPQLQILDWVVIFSIIVLLIGPFIVFKLSSERKLSNVQCLPDETYVILPYFNKSEIHIQTITKSWAPDISEEDFRVSVLDIPDPRSKNYFRKISVPVTIFPSIDLVTDNLLYVMVEDTPIPDNSTLFASCGTIEYAEGDRSDPGFFYPRFLVAE